MRPEKLVPVVDLAERHGVREPTLLLYAPDLIEAYARAGEREAAMRELAKLAELARSVKRCSALAAVARLHGLLGTDDDLDEHFGAALKLHEQGAGSSFERARTELLYGERLRRAKRRIEAREHLRSAIELFDGLGAAPGPEGGNAAPGERAESRSPDAIPQRPGSRPRKSFRSRFRSPRERRTAMLRRRSFSARRRSSST